MSASHTTGRQTDTDATAATVARVLRGARINDQAALPTRHAHRTPQCLPVSRVLAVATQPGARWTDAEQRHLDACAFCRNVFDAFNSGPRPAVTDDETETIAPPGADETAT